MVLRLPLATELAVLTLGMKTSSLLLLELLLFLVGVNFKRFIFSMLNRLFSNFFGGLLSGFTLGTLEEEEDLFSLSNSFSSEILLVAVSSPNLSPFFLDISKYL